MSRTVRIAMLACVLALAGCSTMPPGQLSPLAQYRASPNHDLRKPSIIVLHYTVEDTLEGSRRILSDARRRHPVSAHYLLDRDGRILQLVPDHLRAWHAGDGSWGGLSDLNDASIGIEIINTGSEPFPDAQIDALIRLLGDLTTRHAIPRTRVIGHADLAPARKIDPGRWFPWKRLFDAGYGIWPQDAGAEAPPGFDGWNALRLIGYPLTDPRAALRAFRLRFRGLDDGERGVAQVPPAFDAEDLRILHALTRTQAPAAIPP